MHILRFLLSFVHGLARLSAIGLMGVAAILSALAIEIFLAWLGQPLPPPEIIHAKIDALAADLCQAAKEQRVPDYGHLESQFGFAKFPADLAQYLRVYPAFAEGCDFHVEHMTSESSPDAVLQLAAHGRDDYVVSFSVYLTGGRFKFIDESERGKFNAYNIRVWPTEVLISGRRCPNPFVPAAYGFASRPPEGCPYYWNWPPELMDPAHMAGVSPR